MRRACLWLRCLWRGRARGCAGGGAGVGRSRRSRSRGRAGCSRSIRGATVASARIGRCCAGVRSARCTSWSGAWRRRCCSRRRRGAGAARCRARRSVGAGWSAGGSARVCALSGRTAGRIARAGAGIRGRSSGAGLRRRTLTAGCSRSRGRGGSGAPRAARLTGRTSGCSCARLGQSQAGANEQGGWDKQ